MDYAHPATLHMSSLILGQQQIDDYMTHGYLRFGKVLDDREIKLLRNEYDREIARARKAGYLANLAATDGQPGTGDAKTLEVSGVVTRNLRFRKLVHAYKILDIVEDLIGPNIRLLGALLLYKPPREGSPVYWHQDNTYYRCFPPNMVSGWLTLDDVAEDNGAMEMLPGSHLHPSWEDWGDDVDNKLDTSNAVLIELPAGGIMFHHCQVLHRSTPNRSDRPRRAIVMLFVPIGTRSSRLNAKKWGFFMHPVLRMKI